MAVLIRLQYASRIERSTGTMSQSTTSRSKRSRTGSTQGGVSDGTGRTKNTTPYDPNFEQKMIDGGVYPDGYEGVNGTPAPLPANMEELQEMLCRQRASLSPSQFPEGAFTSFKRANAQASREAGAMTDVMPVIAGQRDSQFRPAREVLYTNAAPIVPGVSKPKPDACYGAQPSQIDPLVRRDLAAQIVPSRQETLPAAPNFTFEGKGKSGSAEVAQRQVMNNGAYGSRAMLSLQNYGRSPPRYDGNAYTIGVTYHPGTGTMQMYASHPVQAAGRPTDSEYYTTQVGAYAMTHSSDAFRRGAGAFRNARDWTQEQRDCFIAAANANANASAAAGINITDRRSSNSASTPFISVGSSANCGLRVSSDTSADELAGPATPMKRQRRRG